ncbi:MAG: arylsulfatase [Gemmataceae bacterium]
MRSYQLATFATLLLMASNGLAQQRPNIIYVIVDDMGYADLSCYGQKSYKTPNLDRMAAQGIRFTDAYSGSTVCAPSRSTIMTGQHTGHTPLRVNGGGAPLPDEVVTLTEVLKQAGYATGGFGKWGLGDVDTEGVPEKQGFDRFFGYYDQVHAHNYYPSFLVDTGKRYDLNPKLPEAKRHTQNLIFREMKKWIRDNKQKPFFCYAPWTPPHARYQIPSNDPAWLAVKDKPWPMRTRGHAAFNLMVDRHVGELFALLQELGIDDNTIVIFSSDNGASMRNDGTLNSCGPFRGFKRSLHEGGLRVPFIVRWPGKIKPGQVTDLPIYFPDLMPTFADLAGASKLLPKDIDGISFVPTLLTNGKQKRHKFMYWEWGRKRLQRGVRHGQWKLVKKKTKWEVYDLSTDLGETKDLSAKHANLIRIVETWIAKNRTEPPRLIDPRGEGGKAFRTPKVPVSQ